MFLQTVFSFSQESVQHPTVDSYVHFSNPNQSYSSETVIKLKHSVSGNNDRLAVLQFSNLSEVPTTYQQVLLKLVQVEGDRGNVSLVGINPEFDNYITLNSLPSQEFTFAYGGVKRGEAYYIDVTEYVLNQLNSNNSVIAFKLFTNSLINSAMGFASSESTENRPELQFYTNKAYEIPLFDVHDTVTIDMVSKGEITGDVLKNHVQEDEVNNYGGWENGTFEATGFFRTEKDCDNTWHIIDPSGNVFYSAGLNTVDNGGLSQPEELKSLGLNTMGSWSDESIKNVAYTPRFNVMSNFKNSSNEIKEVYNLDILPVFEPTFQSFCNQLAQTELQPYLNDPWVLGYFLDNELLFHKDQLSLSLSLETSNAQYQAANTWMIDKYGVNYTTSNITEDDKLDYQGYVGETYFRIVSEAFKAVDPNHMLLGTRFHSGVKYMPKMFEAAGKYIDIISVNYYGSAQPEEEYMDMWLEESGKPFLITEFYVKGLDTPMENADGAGWDVATQSDRASWFENWMLKLLRNKGSVGFHWFRYLDKPTDGSNKGLYDKDYNLYQELGASVKKVSKAIYTLRSQMLYGNYNYNDCEANISILSDEIPVVLSPNFLVHPNPVSDVFRIDVASTSEIKIYDVSGSLLITKESIKRDTEIDISDLSSGLYFVEINKSGKKSVAKLIKN
ncbi:T9SS type A sorting domain-containing protein [Wenyingzhuangia fucanilytica]|nr:T9SS type A sorting domain-containing protein [Wenyingzhuangia fucanilytica]